MPIPWEDRDDLPNQDESVILNLYADQPGNCRSRKPALFLLMFAAGATREEIHDALHVGPQSLERWWRNCGKKTAFRPSIT